ncbi:MAG TPA: hypothetical protein VE983_13500 [Solirubrobacteraceae bacterium]|nr:hypothetical protein [Solirubrobacteraceae bacterium]
MARLIRTLAGLVALVIALGIILRVLSANPHNGIVSDIHDAGAWLVGPFRNVFSVKGEKLNMALNWALALVVYLIVGHLLASLIARLTPRSRFGRARAAV